MECVFTSPVRTECGMFVMYCMQCCMSVDVLSRGCAVSRRYIDVCNCYMFSVVNVYIYHFIIVFSHIHAVGYASLHEALLHHLSRDVFPSLFHPCGHHTTSTRVITVPIT